MDVDIPLGCGITRRVVAAMDTGNLYKMSRLSPEYRLLLSDVYHTGDETRNPVKHIQNAMSDLEGYHQYRAVPPVEMDRLRYLCQHGAKVALIPCKDFDENTGKCAHGTNCNFMHFGWTAEGDW